ncbi:MAG TPA: AAA family ATPase, partial [Acetivibrio sp.]|nr:AAA family ATPase [Acetivibrio sp.]
MLAKIIIKNFMSFKNETVIDFTKTNYKFLENNVSDEGILKGIAFYGANASGKSNVLYAIRFLLDKLFRETENPA